MNILLIVLLVLALFTLIIWLYIKQEKFGRLPSGERLKRITASSNYKEGQFQNQSFTPQLTEGATYTSLFKEFFFTKKERSKPSTILPSIKTDLLHLPIHEDVFIWMGHSSYFMQIDGKRILVDPVLSGAASPIKATTRSFPGADIYTVNDFPEIDILFISHDHWDHLDHTTIKKLKPKVKTVVTGLGTGEHLERWGYDPKMIHEKDWNENLDLGDGFKVTVLPARHFSGRTFRRNRALWASFALQTPHKKIYIGGDSGYDTHFKKIGDEHGPFDMAMLECGQYDKNWKYIHMMPEEVVDAAKELKAQKFIAVHWGKFQLGNHSWDDPIRRVYKTAHHRTTPLLTPMIGEQVNINDNAQLFSNWWEQIK
ncbi:MAG: MBL fold metallo-hydrolase [Bacteroidota bacterium]